VFFAANCPPLLVFLILHRFADINQLNANCSHPRSKSALPPRAVIQRGVTPNVPILILHGFARGDALWTLASHDSSSMGYALPHITV